MSSENNLDQEQKLIALLGIAYVSIEQDGLIRKSNEYAQALLNCDVASGKGNFFHCWENREDSQSFISRVKSEKQVKAFLVELRREENGNCFVRLDALWVDASMKYPAHIECLISSVPLGVTQEEEFKATLKNVSGSIAHLINNKMASVVGIADLLKKDFKHYPDVSKKLDLITRCSLEASDVTHGLVDYAENFDETPKVMLSLSDLIEETAKVYQAKILHENPRKVSFNIEGRLPVIRGNKDQLLTLFSCMLDNAIEATEEGDVIIVSGKEKILKHKKTGEDQRYVMFSVEDHGLGMDEDTQKRIFEPYFSTKFTGRGMSLAIAIKVLKEHEGRIHVKTGKGLGSIFKIYFPVGPKP